MECQKCGYIEKGKKKTSGFFLCSICSRFAPEKERDIKDYISEKIDWKLIDTFRRYKNQDKKKSSMSYTASKGFLVTRAPLGYSVQEGILIPNKDASKVHSLFKTFLVRKYSLNSLAKNFGLSVNGIKKILTNRTYLGEIKFDGQIYKATHQPLISSEIFYAVQRKLKTYLKPRHHKDA